MRNAGPIESPTDPFASVPLPQRATSRKPRIEGLPPGVSRDIFGPTTGRQETRPAGHPPAGSALPPAAPESQPWPVREDPSPAFTDPSPPPSFTDGEPSRRRRLLPAVGVLVLLFVLLAYLVPAVLMSGSVLRGTRVAGVDIGGLTVTQAAEKLRHELAADLSKPVVVRVGDYEDTIQPDEAGLELDVVSTINQVPSGFPSPVEVWRGLTGTTELEPKVTVDASQLSRTVEGLAETVDQPPVEGKVTFKGLRPVVTQPRGGALLDRGEAVKAISDAFLTGAGRASLSLQPAEPATTREAVNRARTQAVRAVQGPITLTLDGKQAQLAPEAIAASLTFVADPDGDGALTPEFDAARALRPVEAVLVDAAQAPRDATYEIVDGRPQLIPSRAGRGVDERRLSRDLVALLRRGGERVLPVTLSAAPPDVTTEEVSGLGIKEAVGSFTSEFDCCQPRVTNIRQMAADLDGHLVRPGQTFSLNDVIGERTAEGGYVPAPQVVGGRLITIMGGGVSQLATTLYNAVFFGGFVDVAHTPMDYHSSRFPAGRDAALLYPDHDLKWRNDSDHGVLIKASSTGTSVTVTLYSTKRYEKIEAVESEKRDFTPFRRETSDAADCQPVAGQQGFTIDVTRVFYEDGEVVKRDKKLTTKYRPRAEVVCTAGG
ncbi:VanW family protein [Nonomuraea sp. MCN248]|uniref:VanW family protein n=1 Tax=Nonomuraea corallina TaxID=2989783 RepID=A0ABT4SHX6_9ACTN|nr:VanW family protein [Nonomuraea corallina]MDA0636545.1 VanW family protein [Nonomuraea corallina]